jgi:hypothetical protein
MSEFFLIFQTPLPPSARTSFVNGPLGKRSAILSCNETREKRDEYWWKLQYMYFGKEI